MKNWEFKFIDIHSRGQIITRTVSGFNSKEEVIKYFGLNDTDVEWYEVNEITK
mgnify:FL=1